MPGGHSFVIGDLVKGQGIHIAAALIVAAVPISDETNTFAVFEICFPVEVKQGLVAIELEQAGLVVDGQFGSETEQAVKTFQTKNGLTVDGIVGKQTWTALITGAAEKQPEAKPTERIYTVVKGDTLWGIAKTHLGSGHRYTEIVALNGLKSSLIFAGQQLKLPQQ